MGNICGSKQDVDKTQLKSESTINDTNILDKDEKSEFLQI